MTARLPALRVTLTFLRHIQHLYRVEAELRENQAGARLRAAVRAAESRMVVQRFHRALLHLRSKLLPKSLLGLAIAYALGQWAGMTVYLEDGRVEIDNNLVENAIRPTALGKKNWLFMGEADAGQRGAILYSLIQSCRRRQIDPYAYLKDVLSRLPTMTTGQIASVTQPLGPNRQLCNLSPQHKCHSFCIITLMHPAGARRDTYREAVPSARIFLLVTRMLRLAYQVQ